MSISKIFYTLLGDKSATFEHAEFHEDYILFDAHIKKSVKKCPSCGSAKIHIKETKRRKFRMLNLGKKRTYLRIIVHKILCLKCGLKAWLKLPFAVGKMPMTKSMMNYVIQLVTISTLSSVAFLLGLSWKTVKNIDKAHLSKRVKRFSYKKLIYISIDEISIKKRHKYMTIFTDISTGQIIHAVEGRKEEDIRFFLKQLSKKAKRLRGVGIDMSASYSKAIKTHLPLVEIIFDRFHVSKLLNDTIEKIRRNEQFKQQSQGVGVIKGQRFLLLRNFVDLDEDEQGSLKKLLEINKPLAIAHSMKEQLRNFWTCKSKKEGAQFLGWWIMEAMESGLAPLAKTARTLLRRFQGLLSYFDHGIDNGKAEGINNKIKVLKRKAYGYNDQEYFKLKLYHLHEKRTELVG